MRIVIVGGGLVGTTLAERLSRDGHDVSVVECDPRRARNLAERLDVAVVEANGATAAALREAGASKADLVVATSNSDEVNLVVGLLARRLFDTSKVIVRLRDPAHEETFRLVHAERGEEHVVVNPDAVAVDRIAALLEVPGASDVASFMDGQLLVAGFRLRRGSDLLGLRVSDMRLMFADTPTLAVAIHRRDVWIVPHGDEDLEEGDLVYLAIAREHLDDVLGLVGAVKQPRRAILIAGAGPIGVELARRLEGTNLPAVLIERDEAKAIAASDRLSKTRVVCGEPTDPELLDQEGIERISTVVAATDDHETNLAAGLLSRRLGAGRALVLVDNVGLVDLVGEIGIDAIISPRVLVIGLALAHIRGRRVRSVAQLLADRIEIVEAEALPVGPLVAAPLSETRLPRGVLVAALRRGDKLVVPTGEDRIEPGDRVLFITTNENAPKLADFLSE